MRLDSFLVDIKLFESRTKAQQAIERGEIYIKKQRVNKSSLNVKDLSFADIEYIPISKFVSLGGYKLQKALNDFEFSVNNLVVADIGASTGGFTDCVLQNGAKKVFAVDLNDELLHHSLKGNKKVVPIIKNARDLTNEDFSDELDLIVADLSFISITYVLETFSNLIKKGKHLIVLIKPQFEIGKRTKYKNGIVKDTKIHEQVCENIIEFSKSNSLKKVNITTAPIVKDKNVEFLIEFVKE